MTSEPPLADKLLLRVEEAALLLSVSRAEAYRLIARGDLGAVRVGSRLRVTQAALDHYVDTLERQAEARAHTPRALLARPKGKRNVQTRSA